MRERGLALLESLGLAEHANKRPNQLSGGQRQRVAIARALANRPEIIVADEPTGALDTASTEQVFSILRDIADQGQTVVVVTHDPALAARADRRIHIVDGKIAETTLLSGKEAAAGTSQTTAQPAQAEANGGEVAAKPARRHPTAEEPAPPAPATAEIAATPDRPKDQS